MLVIFNQFNLSDTYTQEYFTTQADTANEGRSRTCAEHSQPRKLHKSDPEVESRNLQLLRFRMGGLRADLGLGRSTETCHERSVTSENSPDRGSMTHFCLGRPNMRPCLRLCGRVGILRSFSLGGPLISGRNGHRIPHQSRSQGTDNNFERRSSASAKSTWRVEALVAARMAAMDFRSQV